MKSDVKLSAVVLTLNEEANIKRCIASLKEIADEILVIDSFSTDRTVPICESLGVTVFQHVFEGFIEQKNWGVSKARFPHILSIEGDEALSETLQNSILDVKRHWTHDYYAFNRLTRYCGQWIRHSGWYPDRKLRLFDRRKGRFGGHNPHDVFMPVAGATTRHLNGDILHYGFDTISEHVILANKYSDVKAEVAMKAGKKSGWFHILLRPPLRFCKDYFLRLGFRDGLNGFVICTVAAFATFLKYAKLRQMQRAARDSVTIRI